MVLNRLPNTNNEITIDPRKGALITEPEFVAETPGVEWNTSTDPPSVLSDDPNALSSLLFPELPVLGPDLPDAPLRTGAPLPPPNFVPPTPAQLRRAQKALEALGY